MFDKMPEAKMTDEVQMKLVEEVTKNDAGLIKLLGMWTERLRRTAGREPPTIVQMLALARTCEVAAERIAKLTPPVEHEAEQQHDEQQAPV